MMARALAASVMRAAQLYGFRSPSLAKSIAIDTIKSDIEKAMERRDARILLFNTLMRCLSILLDANLLKLTILKSSPRPCSQYSVDTHGLDG